MIWKENPKVGDFLKSLYRQADVYYSKSGYDIFIGRHFNGLIVFISILSLMQPNFILLRDLLIYTDLNLSMYS